MARDALVGIQIEQARYRKAVDLWHRKTLQNMRDALTLSVLDLLSDTIRGWPVDTGRSRAGWYALYLATGESGPGGGPRPGPKGTRNGRPIGGTRKNVREGINASRAKVEDKWSSFSITIENNVGYVLVLESRKPIFRQALQRQTRRFIRTIRRLQGAA